MVPVTPITTIQDLTPEQVYQLCMELVLQLADSAIVCSEQGVHGPTSTTTSCFSIDCSLTTGESPGLNSLYSHLGAVYHLFP